MSIRVFYWVLLGLVSEANAVWCTVGEVYYDYNDPRCIIPNSEPERTDYLKKYGNKNSPDAVFKSFNGQNTNENTSPLLKPPSPISVTPLPPPSPFIRLFNTLTYCRTISDAVGGSYRIEESCRERESESLNQLKEMNLPDRVFRYCESIGRAVGGSYRIMKSCVERELESKKNIGN